MQELTQQQELRLEVLRLVLHDTATATNEAIRYYRQSKSTQCGKMMANCLDVAKKWAGRNSVK